MGLQRSSSGSAELWVLSASLPYHPIEFKQQPCPMERCMTHLVKTGIRVPNRPLPLFSTNAPFEFTSLKYHSFQGKEKQVLHWSTFYLVKAAIISHLMTTVQESYNQYPSLHFLPANIYFPHNKQRDPKEDKPDVSRPCLLPSSCFSRHWEANADLDLVLQANVSKSEWYDPTCLFHLFFSHLISTFWSHTLLCSSKVHGSIHLQILAPAAPSAPRSSLSSLLLSSHQRIISDVISQRPSLITRGVSKLSQSSGSHP